MFLFRMRKLFTTGKIQEQKANWFLFWHSFLDCFTWKHYSNTKSCVAFLCNNYHLKIKIYSLVTNEFKRWWNVLNPQTLDLKDKVVTDKWRPGPGHIKKGESCCLSSTSIFRKISPVLNLWSPTLGRSHPAMVNTLECFLIFEPAWKAWGCESCLTSLP